MRCRTKRFVHRLFSLLKLLYNIQMKSQSYYGIFNLHVSLVFQNQIDSADKSVSHGLAIESPEDNSK